MAVSPGAFVSLLSGIPLILLGALLLSIRPRRPEAAFFGLFGVAWGLQVITAHYGIVVDSAAAFAVSFRVSLALMAIATLFLAQFALRLRPTPYPRWSTAPFVVLALAAAGASLLTPSLVIASVETMQGGALGRVTHGPLALPLFFVPFYGVFYFAVGVVYDLYRKAAPGSERHRYRGMLIALAIVTSYQSARALLDSVDPQALRQVEGWTAAAYPLFFSLGVTFLAGVAAHLAVRPPSPENRDGLLVAAFAVPAAIAGAEALVGQAGMSIHSWGLWRLVSAAVLVRAIARYQLFHVDLLLKRVAAPAVAAMLLSFGAVGFLAVAVGDGSVTAASVPLILGVLTASATFAAGPRVGEVLFPGVQASPEYLKQRKHEVYRAALERILVLGNVTPGDESVLKTLRKSLGITEADHTRLVYQVSAAAAKAPAAASTAPASVPAVPRVEPGARVLDRYRVERLLGEGGHGRAYLARDERRDAAIVIKVVGTALLGGKAAAMLLREAELLRRLDHPNIIRVLEAIEGPHEVLLVMEYADGGSLHGLLQRRSRLSANEGAGLLGQVLSGLEAAHGEGVIHRDIKPENLLLTRDGSVKVVDFGVARLGAGGATAMTAGPIGTLLYMSPEQVRGLDVDARSDLYACGVVFHQMLTGRHYLPIAGKDDFQVRQLILEGEPRLDLRGQPGWVGPFLARALAKDRAERFATAAEMRAALHGQGPVAKGMASSAGGHLAGQ